MTGNGIKYKPVNQPRSTIKAVYPDLQRILVLNFDSLSFDLTINSKKNANKSIICIPQLQLPLHQLQLRSSGQNKSYYMLQSTYIS